MLFFYVEAILCLAVREKYLYKESHAFLLMVCFAYMLTRHQWEQHTLHQFLSVLSVLDSHWHVSYAEAPFNAGNLMPLALFV